MQASVAWSDKEVGPSMARSDPIRPLGVPIPINEEERLAVVRSCNILDTLAEAVFDRLTALASSIFDVPIALISLVDRDRQWFKSKVGLEVEQTSRRDSFCAHAILNDPVMVVPDAREDPRFAENPLVTAAPFIRFYAGAPLVTLDGFRLGTLCIIDTMPHPDGLSQKELDILRDLAGVAVYGIEFGREAAREAAKLREQLQHAGAAKQRFLRMMSHELRTPLNAIIGFSELVERQAASAGNSEQQDYAGHIGTAGRHLLTMIERVLEWARVERGEVRLDEREVVLSEPVDTALALLPDCNGRVILDPFPEKVLLKCDPQIVVQVLANVVDNSLKHCADDTAITLSTKWSEGEPLSILVADQGPGISEEQLQEALNAFEQPGDQFSRKHGGIGLGLAISRKLMELHGGQLRVKTSPSSGTVIELVFPAYRCSAESE